MLQLLSAKGSLNTTLIAGTVVLRCDSCHSSAWVVIFHWGAAGYVFYPLLGHKLLRLCKVPTRSRYTQRGGLDEERASSPRELGVAQANQRVEKTSHRPHPDTLRR